MRKGKSSAFGGVVLVTVGILFLLKNFGLLDISFTQYFAAYWPIGLILAGIASIYKRQDLAFALLFLTAILGAIYGFSQMASMTFGGISWPMGMHCVSGSGNMTSEIRAVDTFTGIHASTGVTVYLRDGQTQTVRVEAEDNIMELVETELDGNILDVRLKGCVRNANPVNVYISSNKINSLDASSAGKIIGEYKIEKEKVSVEASTSGSVNVEVDATEVVADASSAGAIMIVGTTDKLNAKASSSGMLNAYGLTAKEVDADASSAGVAEVYASENLQAAASSAGKILYKGNPTILNTDTSSAGVVQKAS